MQIKKLIIIYGIGEGFEQKKISPIRGTLLYHTFVTIPALLLKNTLSFLIRAGIFTKV